MSFPCQQYDPATVDMTVANKAMEKAKIQLMSRRDAVFFTTLCFSLRHEWSDKVPTAATNGRFIYYNPAFFLGLTEPQRVFLLLHETLHCAYLHMLRLGERDNPQKWNQATDYVINAQLVDAGYEMPPGGLLDRQYDGLASEQVYYRIPDPDPDFTGDLMPPPGVSGDDSGQGGHMPAPGQGPMTQEEMNDILVRASVQAQMAGEDPGVIPGDLKIALDKLLNPRLPWNQILRRYMTRMAKTEYSFLKPNRRFFPEYILPTAHGEALGEIAVAVDTSGSVTNEEFQHFISEAHGILRQLKPQSIQFLQFDTEIKSVNVLRHADDLKRIEFSGRGGTDIAPVMRWAEKHKPVALLMFTDGFFHMEPAPGKVPVIWVIHSNQQFSAPYGKIIPYHFNQ